MPCAAPAQTLSSLPISTALGFERVRLPQGEHMGLVGGTLLFDIDPDWSAGPAIYGAASGDRGGFFVGGVEVQRRWRLASGWSLSAGLYAGGGGGAGAPVGGGLMLRPALTVLKDLGPSLQAGLSWASVRFPSGQIASNQLGVTLRWRGEFVHANPRDDGASIGLSPPTGLGFDRMSLTATSYRLSDGSGRRIGLAGARAERRSSADGFSWGFEAAAAAKGDAAGYLEILGSAAFSTPVMATAQPSWRVGARLSAGLAGGGAVPTGGGLIVKAAGTMEWRFAPGWTLGGELGSVRGIDGPLRARQAQVWIGSDLEPGHDGRGEATGHVVRSEWVGVLQHHTRIERRDGTRQPLDTIGLKLNRYLDDHLYLSGQAHSAYAGGAGAYSVGLVGAGIVTRADAPLRGGAEVLVGAAGGGGVETGGGGIVQGMLWAGWDPSPKSEWRAGIGAMRGWRGGQNTPVLELSWSRSFGMAGR